MQCRDRLNRSGRLSRARSSMPTTHLATTSSASPFPGCWAENKRDWRLTMSKQCNIGLDDRCRDLLNGEIRHKRGDTLVGTLRQAYEPNFAPGDRSDTRLDTLR